MNSSWLQMKVWDHLQAKNAGNIHNFEESQRQIFLDNNNIIS